MILRKGYRLQASYMALVVKNSPANAGDIREAGSIPGLGSPGGGLGNPLQYSCLENPMDRGARWATVHRVKKGQTQLKGLSALAQAMKHTSWEKVTVIREEKILVNGFNAFPSMGRYKKLGS